MSWCKYCVKQFTCTEDPRGCEIADEIEEEKKKNFITQIGGIHMVYYKYVLIIDTNLPVSKEDMKRAAQSWLNGLNIPDTEFILKLKSKLDNKKMFKCVI